jgi:hypothetical protein
MCSCRYDKPRQRTKPARQLSQRGISAEPRGDGAAGRGFFIPHDRSHVSDFPSRRLHLYPSPFCSQDLPPGSSRRPLAPLPRATSAMSMSNECKKLFGLMNFDVEGAVCNNTAASSRNCSSSRVASTTPPGPPVSRSHAGQDVPARRAATTTWDPPT